MRAVAVLAVIAYHADTFVAGGFLGVDVFFVLSGYLITTLLAEELRGTGRVRLAAFWARRARRLLPALFLVLATVAIVVNAQNQVESLDARRGDLLASLFYVANWHFIATDQSYFAQFTGVSPVEHMWSLAIEEQFYLLWPLLLLGLTRFARSRLAPLVGMVALAAVASGVAMALLYSAEEPMRAYVGTDARAHELLIGSALALALLRWPGLRDGARAAAAARLAWAPVALTVLLAFLVLDDESAFYYRGGAVLFSLVVALAIWTLETAPRGALGRAFSVAPVVWVGTVSYGLYLWHWPLLQWFDDPDVLGSDIARRAAAVALTFVVAAASYHALERPVRTGRLPWVRRSTGRLAVVVIAGFAVLAVVSVTLTSVPARSVAAQVSDASVEYCPEEAESPGGPYRYCVRVQAASTDALTIATMGDSTLLALDPGLRSLARDEGWTYVQAGRNGCSFLPLAFPADPAEKASVEEARGCVSSLEGYLDGVAAAVDPDVWVISDRWLLPRLLTEDGRVLPAGDASHRAAIRGALPGMLERLTADGRSVVLVLPYPGGPPVACADDDSAAVCHAPELATNNPALQDVRGLLRDAAAAAGPRVAAVDLNDVICPASLCPAVIDGTLVRYDTVHFTSRFSRYVVPILFERAARAGIDFEPR